MGGSSGSGNKTSAPRTTTTSPVVNGASTSTTGNKTSITTPNFGTVGLGKKGRKQLAMADYQNAMQQQTQDRATEANRVDQTTPWGTVDWKQDENGKWSQTTTLSPAEQAALESQQGVRQGLSNTAQGMIGGIGDTYSKPMDWSGLSAAGTPATGPGADQFRHANAQNLSTEMGVTADDATRQRVEDALYQRARSRLDPEQSQQQRAMLSRLYSMGAREGDPLYERQQQNLFTAQGDQNQQAMWNSITGGGAEQSRLFDMASTEFQNENAAKGQQFGMDTAAAGNWNDLVQQGYGNQRQTAADLTAERTRQAQEALMQRGQGLNELTALLTGQQVGMPQFSGTPNTTAGTASDPNYYGAFTDKQAMSQGGGMMQQLMGLGGQLGAAYLGRPQSAPAGD